MVASLVSAPVALRQGSMVWAVTLRRAAPVAQAVTVAMVTTRTPRPRKHRASWPAATVATVVPVVPVVPRVRVAPGLSQVLARSGVTAVLAVTLVLPATA
jgi:hypothetical protein